MRPHVAWIHIAPIKSLQIAERDRVMLDAEGVAEDRRFCIVDENARWLNAKRVPAFVAVRPEFDAQMRRLTLHLPGGTRVAGPIEIGEPLTVTIHRHQEMAHEVLGPFGEALSEIGERPVRLVRFDAPGLGVDRAEQGGAASLVSAASLDAMGEVTGDGPIDPRRFRMLFGIAGVPAHTEDQWIGREIGIGEAVVVPEGNVGRCAVTSVDPVSGRSDLDTLGALARYRGDVETTEPLPFGVWARVARPGTVAVGDAVTV